MVSSTPFAVRLAALALFLVAAPAIADPGPTEPFGASVYNEGSTCHIQWTADTTGRWNRTNIELMTGPNKAMVHLKTIAQVDTTDPTNTSYDYPCYSVTPNSAIYFYQFTSPDVSGTLWTTRFTIAGPNGETTPPPNATQPDGEAVPWGTGALEDPSQSDAPPAAGTGGSAVPSGTSSGTEDATPSDTSDSSTAPTTSASKSSAPSSSGKSSSTTSTAPSSTKSGSANSINASSGGALFGLGALVFGFVAAL